MKSRTSSTTLAFLAIALITLVILTIGFWANLQWVKQLPPKSEFQEIWLIARDLIFLGENPYTNPGGKPFTSPIPNALLYSPLALIENYQIARALWLTLSQVATVIFGIFCIRVTSWQAKNWLSGFFLIFVLIWFPSVSVYVRGSEIPMIAVFFTAAIYAIINRNDELAGILLGLSALQPRVTLLGVLLVFLWAGTQRRWRVHFWAGVVFLLSSGIGMIFFPGWLLDFFWSTLRYVDFSPGSAIIDTTTRWWPGVGIKIGWGIFIFVAIILIIEWWLVLGKDHKRLIWVLALTFILTIWLGIETNIDNVYMLMLSLTVIFMAWNRQWRFAGQVFVIFGFILLLIGLWWAFIIFARQGISEILNPIIMIGFPLLSLISLYWVRWWFLRPTYLDEGL